MGTDIHVDVQMRADGANEWVSLPAADDLTARNYDVFAILANVRNGSDFAGIRTGKGFNFISEPRGLPADYDYSNDRETGNAVWLGDHSFSWLTLREILEFDYEQTTTHYGVIPLEAYETFKIDRLHARATGADPTPADYCADISGPNIVILDENDAALTKIDPIADGKSYHVRVSWQTTYRQNMEWFLAALESYKAFGLDNVRLVFGFDS